MLASSRLLAALQRLAGSAPQQQGGALPLLALVAPQHHQQQQHRQQPTHPYQQLAERWVSHSQASCSGDDGPAGATPSGAPAEQQPQQPGGAVAAVAESPAAAASGADAPLEDPGSDLPPTQAELVEQYLSPDLMNRKQLLQQRKAAVVAQFQRFSGDTGSPEVQVAVLTERIRDMMEHFKTHRKDHHSMRGLQAMLNQRRALLSYLRRTDFESFCYVIHKLGLRDNNYARQVRFDKYRVGSRLGTPAEAIKRYGFR